jgi:addiction module RelE/StbE family toxin
VKVEATHKFIKIFKKRISHQPTIKKKFFERTRLFEKNTMNPLLKDHALGGKLNGFRSFSITGNIRVIYFIENEIAYLVDIGTHNHVYK